LDLDACYNDFKQLHAVPIEYALFKIPQLPNAQSPRIIDLHCNMGASASALAAKYPEATLTVVENDASMLAHAKSQVPDSVNATFLDGDLSTLLSSGAEPADLVLAQTAVGSVTEHVPGQTVSPQDLEQMLRDLVRPGGVLVMVVNSPWPKAHKTMSHHIRTDPAFRSFLKPSAEARRAVDEGYGLGVRRIHAALEQASARLEIMTLANACVLPVAETVRFSLGFQLRRLAKEAPAALLDAYAESLVGKHLRYETDASRLDGDRHAVPMKRNLILAVKK
jgi:trans-aconitate methyltransferase